MMIHHYLGQQLFFTEPNQLVLDQSSKALIMLNSPFIQEDLPRLHLLQLIQVIITTSNKHPAPDKVFIVSHMHIFTRSDLCPAPDKVFVLIEKISSHTTADDALVLQMSGQLI